MNEVPSTNWDPLTNKVWHWAHWPFFAKHFLSHSFSITLSLGKFSDVRKTPVGRYPVVGPVVGSRQHSLSHHFPVALSFGGMLRLPLSFTLLLMASTLTYVVAQKPGSFVDGGDTLVSAMMVSVYYFLENTRRVCWLCALIIVVM